MSGRLSLTRLRCAWLHRRIAAAQRNKQAIALDAAERLHAENKHIDHLLKQLQRVDPLPSTSEQIARRISLREKRLS